jgi:hypothetical protein|tara:strand:+ start:3432 stop:4274 length:843 start_codon:yes stop_codon:yes gene_type:complete
VAAIITKNPIIFTAGTGVNIDNDGTEYTGENRLTVTIAIPQAVSTSSNVEFGGITLTKPFIIGNETKRIKLDSYGISGSFSLTGSLETPSDLNVSGSTTILGKVVAEAFILERSSSQTIQKSGSTLFGDVLNDRHDMSGSLTVSGSSISLNSYSITEISNDTSLSDSNASTVATENAIKSYTDTNANTVHTYFRKNYVHTGSFVNASTSSFTVVTASSPTGITDTSENDFFFFNNSQLMEYDALEIEQSGSKLLLKVNNSSIGYDLEAGDEVVAWGKFNS